MSNTSNGVKIKFSIEFLLDKLKNVDKNLTLDNLKSYNFKKFNEGQAFMSEIVQLNFEWKKEVPMKSVILKIPGFQSPGGEEQNVEQALNFLEGAHTRECVFYQLFASPPIPLKLPKYYYGYPFSRHNSDGLMILEDLSKTSRTIGMLPGFSNEQTEAVVVELAKIYASSLLDQSWRGKLIDMGKEKAIEFIEESKRVAQGLRVIKPEWFDKLLDDFEPAYEFKYHGDCFYEGTKFGIPSGMLHNDLWAANVLWKKDKDGNATDELEAIIDWQICMDGNPGADLARTFGLNTSTKYRHENEERLLKLHYDTVNELLGGKISYSFDQFKNAYKRSFPYVATVMGFGVPLYYKMGSVVGEPNDPSLQLELLKRAHSFFQDTLEVMKNE